MGSSRSTRPAGARREGIVSPRRRAVGAGRETLSRWGKPTRRRRVRHIAKVGTRTRTRCTAPTPVSWRGWASVEVVGWIWALGKTTRSRRSILVGTLNTRTSASLESCQRFVSNVQYQRKW